MILERSQTLGFAISFVSENCCAAFVCVQTLYEMLEREPLKALADEAFGKADALKGVTKAVAKAWKVLKDGGSSHAVADTVRLCHRRTCLQVFLKCLDAPLMCFKRVSDRKVPFSALGCW